MGVTILCGRRASKDWDYGCAARTKWWGPIVLEAGRAAPADELECYAVDGERPRFVARSPSPYLLCFKHERLARIEATVRLPGEGAAKIFADACGLWLKKPLESSEECAGSEGGIAFAGHFESEPDESAQLTIQLDAADPAHRADPAAER